MRSLIVVNVLLPANVLFMTVLTRAYSHEKKSDDDFDKIREGNVYNCCNEAIFGGQRSVRWRNIYQVSSQSVLDAKHCKAGIYYVYNLCCPSLVHESKPAKPQ